MINNEGNPLVNGELHDAGTEPLQQILEQLGRESRDIQLSMITTPDGLTMATLGDVKDVDRVGARSAELLSLSREMAAEFERGEAEQILLRGDRGFLIIMPAGPSAVLAVMTRPDANLGMVFLDLDRVAMQIAGAL